MDGDGDMVVIFGFIGGRVDDDDFGEIGFLNTSAGALIDGEAADSQISHKFGICVTVAFILRNIKETLHRNHHSIGKSLIESRCGRGRRKRRWHDEARYAVYFIARRGPRGSPRIAAAERQDSGAGGDFPLPTKKTLRI